LNSKLLIYGTHQQIPGFDSVFFDYSQLKEPYVEGAFIALDHNGTFYDSASPKIIGEPVLIPYRDFEGKSFQFFLSDYTLNTFFCATFGR
jgi:hypothetical protein